MNNDKSNPFTRDLIFKKYNGHCAYCGCKIEKSTFCVDHIVPLKRGTPEAVKINKIENYNPACLACNSSKNSFTISEWRDKLYTNLIDLNKITKYVLLRRHGVIKEVNQDIIFYFEKHEPNK